LIAAASLACVTACSSTSAKPATDGSAAAGPVTVIPGVQVSVDRALHDQLPDAIKQAGVVRVATDVPYAPFEMYVDGSTTQMTGIDYDLGQALGAKLGVRFTFSEQKFDGILPAMQAGKFDAAMAGMTDKRKREAAVDFVDYSNSGTGLLVLKGNPKNFHQVTDLCGQTVAVQAGTNQEKLIQARQAVCSQAGKPAIGVQVYPKDSDAQLALRSGKVSADVIDLVAAAWTAKSADGGATFDAITDTAAVGGSGASPNGIAVVKSLPQLSDAMTKALQELIDDGTYGKILDHYGVAAIALPKATKNAAVD
jgi:polar amino acid transport system substrate-binding protein